MREGVGLRGDLDVKASDAQWDLRVREGRDVKGMGCIWRREPNCTGCSMLIRRHSKQPTVTRRLAPTVPLLPVLAVSCVQNITGHVIINTNLFKWMEGHLRMFRIQ
jgi:hypothetical protein